MVSPAQASPAQTPAVNPSFSSVVGSRMVSAAKTYKGAADGAYYTVLGTTECTIACVKTAYGVWTRGLVGNLKELGKSCYGINEFVAAKNEMGRSVEKVKDQEVRVPLSERVGKASTHVVNGVSKIAMTNSALFVGATYGAGVASQALGADVANSPILRAATMTATGLNTMAGLLYDAAWLVSTPASAITKAGVAAISATAGAVVNHPGGAAAMVGVSLSLYGASCLTVKASESTNAVSKIAYEAGAVAATGIAGACALWAAVG